MISFPQLDECVEKLKFIEDVTENEDGSLDECLLYGKVKQEVGEFTEIETAIVCENFAPVKS